MAVRLQKGQRVSLKKEAPNLRRILVEVKWDPIEKQGIFNKLFGYDFDVDASVIIINKYGKKEAVVCFKDKNYRHGAIKHCGDNLTGKGDGEQIKINLDQLSRTSQVVLAEAAYDGKNYVDAFGVTNALNNREVSDSWSRSGQNVFEQAYARGQFSVIKNGRIQKFVNRADLIGYQAFIDCLYLGGTLPMHGYCSFKAWSKSPEGRIAYVTGGNRFDLFDELTPEARARRYCLNDPIQLQYFSMNQEEQYVPVLVVQNE